MRITATALFASGLVALPYLFAPGPNADPQAPGAQAPAAAVTPAQQLMARMVKAYAEARSYQDEGEVVLIFTDPAGRRTQKKPFATRFVRPGLFRFEFTERDAFEELKRYVIWSDAAPDRAKTWWTVRPKVEEQSLAMAVGAAAGVSSLSSLTVPRPLMPAAIPSQSLADLRGPKIVDVDVVDGAPCDKVEGTDARGNKETLWIDKASSLVRKVSLTFEIPGGSVESTTTYRPQIGVEIAADAFTFEPPAGPK
jgi:outer membrane lipoprotein-sorting protein